MSRIRELSIVFAAACALRPALGAEQSPVEIAALHGKVVYLDFWASWCVPCRQSFPWMQMMQADYAGRGLTVIAVNLDHDRADADSFLRRYQPAFSVRFDPQGEWAEHFKVRGMPSSVLIDRQGTVRFSHIGFRPADGPRYEEQIKQLLAEH
jgi:cytochrome c biogenesis protein CcmG, thiol:disulfide interchange protein DsbE